MSKTFARTPTVNTLEMIEIAIKKVGMYPSINQLSRRLERQVQYATIKKALRYLEKSNKIMFDKDSSIIWIFADNPKLNKLINKSTKLR
jgi:DNA-binding transcriptional regulator YhcF (GntR family)